MTRKILSFHFALLSLLFLPYRSPALQLCANATDEADCEAKVRAELLKDTPIAQQGTAEDLKRLLPDKDEMTEDAKRELLEKVAPEVTALPGASAAFEDFLSRLKIGVTSDEDGMEGLALDFTDFLGLSPEDGYKLQAVARDPVLYEELSNQLSEEDREERTGGLGSFDDVLVSFVYSPTTPRFGNNLAASQLLIDTLFQEILAGDKVLSDEALNAKNRRDDLASDLAEVFPDAFPNGELRSFDDIGDESRRADYRDAVEQAEVAEAVRLDSMSKMLGNRGFFRIADLVANQPQLVAKVTRSVRAGLVGPEETTLHLSFEKGFVNVNTLRKALRTCGGTPGSCFASYMTDDRLATADKQNRVTFSLDWTQRRNYHEAVDGVTVDTAGNERWTISGAYGRNLRRDENGDFTSRYDFTGSWEDWSDDPLHQDRGLLKLSFTQKVTGDMSLVLGTVWATKPEFRDEVDKEVSARFGFTYRFLDKEGKKVMRDQLPMPAVPPRSFPGCGNPSAPPEELCHDGRAPGLSP